MADGTPYIVVGYQPSRELAEDHQAIDHSDRLDAAITEATAPRPCPLD